METTSPVEEHKDIFAEEMVKHVLLKVFGIYWEPDPMKVNSQKLPLKDFYTSCVLLGEAVTTGWRKFYAAVELESRRIHKILNSSTTSPENVCACLKEVFNKIDLPKEFILFIVMAVFGELCLLISKSGAEYLISTAVSGAKRFILDGGLANKTALQMNSVQFMEFCDSDKSESSPK